MSVSILFEDSGRRENIMQCLSAENSVNFINTIHDKAIIIIIIMCSRTLVKVFSNEGIWNSLTSVS